jgi:NAD(P)-dependent dehydrogenase (short-subunit alcohol dehydrogenase family)
MASSETLTQTRFARQVALVTGAASGIGRATALLFAQQGARVLVADLDQPGMAETVKSIEAGGGIAFAQSLDVTSESDWERAIDTVKQKWGRLDVLVNCAGIALVKPVAEMTLEDWRRVLAVNLDGVFLGTRAGVRAMKPAGIGSIVNVASTSGLRAFACSSAYCASKAAVIMLTKVAALECLQDGSYIRINAVAPAGVKTPLWQKTPGADVMVGSEIWESSSDAPIGKRFADPVEIARVILFLASLEASYITGIVIPVDAGHTV